jgi:hypothetical protein
MMRLGTCALVGDDKVEIQWANWQFKKTIQICKRNNILIMQSSSGFNRFKSFAAKNDTAEDNITCFNAHPDAESLVLTNEDDDDQLTT